MTAVLVLLMSGLALSPAGAEAPMPSDTPVVRLEGLAPGSGVSAQSVEGDVSVSRPVDAPIAFSMVGFELPSPDVVVEFRTSDDGRDWTEWTEVEAEPDEGPDPGSPEAAGDGNFSAPVWVGDTRYVQTRVEGASTRDVAVELIDATGANRSVAQRTADAVRAAFRGAAAPALASPGQPDIVTRAGWGANASWQDNTPGYSSRVRFGVVHHTAGTNDYTQAEAKAVVRGIHAYHVVSRGWSDIGYQFLVDKFGTVYEGRHGGITRGVIGAHAGGFNWESFGVSLIGDYSRTSPSTAQFESLAQLLAWKFELHHIDPMGTLYRTSAGSSRYRSGTVVKLNTLSGHRDVSSTTCPAGGYTLLEGLRREIVDRSGPVIASPDASTSVVRLSRDRQGSPVSFAALLRPAGAWRLEVRNAEGGVVHASTGEGSSVDATWTPANVDGLGRFAWTVTSDGRRSAGGSLDVVMDVVDRVGGDAKSVEEMLTDIARAAFPEAGSADHAVLARDDVFADALAGGPLAGTGGPVLFTPSGALAPAVRAELERVLPAGRTVYLLGGTQAVTPSVEADLARTWNVVRLGGANRYETAVLIGDVVRARHGGSTAMIARSGPDDRAPWADALAGGAWGAAAGVPVLLTPTNAMNAQTRDALGRWGISRSIVLGGPEAVSASAAAGLPGAVRVAGADRAGTSADIARRLWQRTAAEPGGVIALADGYRADAWKPALAASPLSARRDAPVILTASDALSASAASYLSELGHTPDNPGAALAIGTAWRISQTVSDQASARLQ